MHFFDKPPPRGARGARIALRGSSATTATSADLLAAAREQRAARAAERAAEAAAVTLQCAVRGRSGALEARVFVESVERGTSVSATGLAAVCGRGGRRGRDVLDWVQDGVRGKGRLGAWRAAMIVLRACGDADKGEGVERGLTVVKDLLGIYGVGGVELLRDGNVWDCVRAVAVRCGGVDKSLREVVDSVLVACDEVGDGELWMDGVRTLLGVSGAAERLRLGKGTGRGGKSFADRLFEVGAEGMEDVACEDAVAVLENVLWIGRGVWGSRGGGRLWGMVNLVAELVRQLPDGVIGGSVDAAGVAVEGDGDVLMNGGGAVVVGMLESLGKVVSDESVRTLFGAAVAEGRGATVRVCKLFNLLTRREQRLRMRFQSSLAFWRGDPHILAGLWRVCLVPDAAGILELDLSGDAHEVLLAFVRSYSHFLQVQDEDEMFNSARPFAISTVVDIALILKRALFAALYVRGPPGNDPIRMAGAVIRNERTLLEDVAKLLSRLHIVDSRRPFRTSDDFWIAGGGVLSSSSFIQDAVDAGSEALVSTSESDLEGRVGPNAVSDGFGDSKVNLGVVARRKACVLGAGELLRVAPYMAPFSSRAKVFQMWVAAEREKFAGPAALGGINGRWITVRRNYLFDDAFEKMEGERGDMKRALRVRFIDEHGMEEAGIDGGGVYKEFLFEVLRLAVSPSLYRLFSETPDGSLYPNPAAHVVDERYEERFEFIGGLLGKALFDGVIVDIPLASFFLSKLLRKFNYPSDLRSLDPELYKNLMFLRTCDDADVVDSLGLNFVATNQAFGKTTEYELVRDGSNVPVTALNRIEYIHRVSNYRMNTQIRKQSEAFIRGFSDVIRPEYIQLFSERELQLLISGATGALDVDDLRRNTKYSGGYTEESDVIRWLWQAVSELDAEDQSRLLQFVTSSPRAPLLGFAYLNPCFCVHRAEGESRLPTASTCMNLLKLPHYRSKEALKEKLQYSLEANSGFDLS